MFVFILLFLISCLPLFIKSGMSWFGKLANPNEQNLGVCLLSSVNESGPVLVLKRPEVNEGMTLPLELAETDAGLDSTSLCCVTCAALEGGTKSQWQTLQSPLGIEEDFKVGTRCSLLLSAGGCPHSSLCSWHIHFSACSPPSLLPHTHGLSPQSPSE